METDDYKARSKFDAILRTVSIRAARAGIDVRVEEQQNGRFRFVWYGTEAQFREHGLLTPSMRAPKRKTLRYFGPVDGELEPFGLDRYRYEIFDSQPLSRAALSRYSKAALADGAYQQFRAAMLRKLPATDMGTEQ